MPITTLDPKSALVVIDLQMGLLGYPTLRPIVEIIARAGELAAAFRRRSLPVVLVNAAGRAPGRTDVAGRSLALAAELRARGVTQVVVVGVSTSNGVEASARQAFDLGFNVTLPIDAITDVDPQAHDNSVTRIYPRIAETGSAADVLALLHTRGQ